MQVGAKRGAEAVMANYKTAQLRKGIELKWIECKVRAHRCRKV